MTSTCLPLRIHTSTCTHCNRR